MTTAPAKTNVLEEFMLRYGPPAGERGPELFVREVLGADPDPWQVYVLRAYGRCERKISIAACHGPGKTAVAAWCAAHQLVCRFPQAIGVTAPTGAQMYDAFYKELKIWLKKLPKALYQLLDVKSDRIELVTDREQSFLTAKTAKAEQPEALAGLHCEGGFVLLVVDEASGVPEPIFEAATGSMSGTHVTMILLGNPIRQTGYFHKSQTVSRGWVRLRITAVEQPDGYEEGTYFSPRPGKQFVQDVIDEYGVDSNAYRIRCLGLFPKADYDALIPFELVESATTRDVQPNRHSPIVWGVDVARFGSDATALCKRQGNALMEKIRTWHELDIMQVVGVVMTEWETSPANQRPAEILVDVIGLGAGVVDRLRELKLPVRGINVSELPALDGSQCVNLRTEGWYNMKAWFAARDVTMPKDDKLQAELVAQRYKILNSNGRRIALPKEEMRKDLHRSPDRADALMLTFCGTAASALYGHYSQSWDQPVLRNSRAVV